jgi:hypothetical protein
MELRQAAPPVFIAFLIISEWGRKNYLLSVEKAVKKLHPLFS